MVNHWRIPKIIAPTSSSLLKYECIDCGGHLSRKKSRCSKCALQENTTKYYIARADRRRADKKKSVGKNL